MSEERRAAAPRRKEGRAGQAMAGGEAETWEDQGQGGGSACHEGVAGRGDQGGGATGESGVRVGSSSTHLLVPLPVIPESPVAPPPWSPLPATPLWHALPPPCLWSSQVSASPPALACLALPSLRQGAAARRSSLLVFPDDCSPVDSPHGRVEVPYVLIPWIRAVRLQLRERFRQDLLVLRLHSDRGGEFSSNFMRDFCRVEGILQSFPLPASPQQNGIAERCIGLVMEVARTSIIHAAAPHFLWPFAVPHATHQLNLWPCVSLLETSPTPRLTGEVGDASVFRVWDSSAFVCDMSADKLSARAIPCVFLGFPLDAPGWQFYHPTSRRVIPSQDVTFDESVPFYRLFPYRSAPPPPPPLFLAPGPPLVDPISSQGLAPSGAASGGADPGGAESEVAGSGGTEPGGAEPAGAEPASVEPGGAEPEGVEPGGAESEGAESGGAEPRGTASSGGLAAARAGDAAAGDTGAGGAGVTAGAGGTGGAAAAGPGGACTRGTRAAGIGGVGGVGARDPTEPRAAGAGGAGSVGAGAGGTGVGGASSWSPVFYWPYTPITGGSVCPPRDQSQPLLQPASPVPAPPYTEQTGSLTERHEPASRPASPVCTGRRVPRPRPPPVPGTHAMSLHPSSVPLRVSLPPPPESSLPAVPDLEFDRARAAIPTISRLLATVVTDPSFDSTAASALVAELVDITAAYHLDYATALVAESESASPASVGGECALGTDVLADRQEDFECLAAAVPRFASMLLAPEGDQCAPDIPTPRSYAKAITGPYSSQWQAAMDAEMAFWKSTGTYYSFLAGWPARGDLAAPPTWLEKVISWRYPVEPSAASLRCLPGTSRVTRHTEHYTCGSGVTPSTTDPSLSLRTDTSLLLFYVLVYVDDLVFATADTEALTLVKSEPQKRHICTDLDELRSYLGLQITRDRARRTIPLTQSHMVHRVLHRFGFQFSLPQPTPLSTSHSLSAPPSDESVEPSGAYAELVGCLMYLMTCTRPELAYPLSLLARYVALGRHRKVHWDAAKRVMRYLCSTLGTGLVLGGRGPVVFTGHADASWVDDSATQWSSQGYTISLGSGSVSWRSTRSSSVLSSSCEAKIYAGAMAAQELRSLTYLLTDLGEKPRSPPILYVDNKAMIALCHEHRLEHRT
ncbi:unnamed protein product [Closterium sp. NIES-53]